jgi:hypothetical protein
MKIAMYKIISCNLDVPREFNEYNENNDDLVRLTETVEVDFKPLQDEEVIKNQVDFLDNSIKQVQAAAESKINELKQKKQELLALPSSLDSVPQEI